MLKMIVETNWNTTAMKRNGFYDGISPSKASLIVKEFGKCPCCDSSLNNVEVKDAFHEDGDVLWENREGGSTHQCESCNTELKIFVEEKAFTTIYKEALSEEAKKSEYLIFVPFDDGTGYFRINTHQIMINEVGSIPQRGQPSSTRSSSAASGNKNVPRNTS